MKTYSRIFFAAFAAAFGLASCAQEELAPAEKPQDRLVTVHFGAESQIAATKATLTAEDEQTFKSAWENGDVLSVEYSYNYGEPVTATAEWKGSNFEAQLAGETGPWMYDVVYPAPDSDKKADCGSSRRQNGNQYNSKYDFMYGSATAENAAAGKTDDGKDIVFNMNRQTAIAYFHLTGTLNEDVVSAKLSVEGEIACLATSSAKVVEYAKGYEFGDTESNALKEITITFEDGTAPKASDFKLWFNVLPTTIYSTMTLVVETTGHTLTISKTAKNEDDGTYEAGKLYKVVKEIPAEKWVAKTTPTEPLELSFDFKKSFPASWPTSESDAKDGTYSYAIGETAYNFVHVGGGIYCGGTAGNSGYLMIPKGDKLGLPCISGYRLTKVVGTLNDSGSPSTSSVVSITDGSSVITGGDGQTWSTKGDSYTYKLSDTEENGLYYLSVSTKNCQMITLVLSYEPADPAKPSLSIDKTSKTWASTETDAFVVKVSVNAEGGDWTVSPTELSWAAVAVDKKAGTITVTPNGENTSETANEATLTVTHASDATLTKTITLKQNAAGSAVETKLSTLTLSSSKKFGTTSGSKLSADDNKEWTVTTSSGAIQNSYQSSYYGQQFGVGNTAWTGFFASDFTGKSVSKIVITANTGSKATVAATIGGVAFGDNVSVTKKANSEVSYTFESIPMGGVIQLTVSDTSKAFYLGKIIVTYTE